MEVSSANSMGIRSFDEGIIIYNDALKII